MMSNHPSSLESRDNAALQVLRSNGGLSASIGEVIGAIALSVVVLSLSAFGITAGINHSQDSNAEAALQSVRSAQILHQSKTDTYGTMEELLAGEAPSLMSPPDNLRLFVDDDGRGYCAMIESGSMSRPQLFSGPRGSVVQLKNRVDTGTLKGCHTDGRSVRITKHGSEKVSIASVPAGATTTCLRFNVEPGADVIYWYIGITYLDAALKPVGNTKSPKPGGGFYTSNGAARTPDVDGYCFGLGPEVKNVQWNFASDTSWYTIGSTYRDVAVIFR